MKKFKIPYNDLDRHFTSPKVISPFYSGDNIRFPRKFKKEWKHILKFKFATSNQKLWWILDFTNPNYKRFLIKKICHA